MNNSIKGAEHFSEIVQIARELTTDIKNAVDRRNEMTRLTIELLTYQSNRPVVTLTIH